MFFRSDHNNSSSSSRITLLSAAPKESVCSWQRPRFLPSLHFIRTYLVHRLPTTQGRRYASHSSPSRYIDTTLKRNEISTYFYFLVAQRCSRNCFLSSLREKKRAARALPPGPWQHGIMHVRSLHSSMPCLRCVLNTSWLITLQVQSTCHHAPAHTAD